MQNRQASSRGEAACLWLVMICGSLLMATAVGSALCQSQQTLREPDALHQPLEPPQAAPHRVVSQNESIVA